MWHFFAIFVDASRRVNPCLSNPRLRMSYTEEEFESLYRECFPSALRLAVNLLGGEDEARDVVHEVFMRVWEGDTRLLMPQAFVLKAVRNAALNRLEQINTRERIHRRIALEAPPPDYDPDTRAQELRAAISRLLTPREQEVVETVYAERMTYRESAEHLGVSVSTVNKAVVSALKKLRTYFNPAK